MRPRTLALVSILVAVGALAVFLFFASRDDSERNDALLFLDRYDGLDVDDPLEERRTRTEQLARLPLAADAVDRVRDQCVAANEALIHAEDLHHQARRLLDEATAGGIEESEIPTATRAEIEAAIQESNEEIRRSREDLFPQCMDGERNLRLRFTRQR